MGCKKDSSSSNSSSNNGIKVKYEILFPGTSVKGSQYSPSNLTYTVGSTGAFNMSEFPIGLTSSWTREEVFTTSARPLVVNVNAQVYVSEKGNLTANIYVNGEKKTTSTLSTSETAVDGAYWGTVGSQYVID